MNNYVNELKIGTSNVSIKEEARFEKFSYHFFLPKKSDFVGNLGLFL